MAELEAIDSGLNDLSADTGGSTAASGDTVPSNMTKPSETMKPSDMADPSGDTPTIQTSSDEGPVVDPTNTTKPQTAQSRNLYTKSNLSHLNKIQRSVLKSTSDAGATPENLKTLGIARDSELADPDAFANHIATLSKNMNVSAFAKRNASWVNRMKPEDGDDDEGADSGEEEYDPQKLPQAQPPNPEEQATRQMYADYGMKGDDADYEDDEDEDEDEEGDQEGGKYSGYGGEEKDDEGVEDGEQPADSTYKPGSYDGQLLPNSTYNPGSDDGPLLPSSTYKPGSYNGQLLPRSTYNPDENTADEDGEEDDPDTSTYNPGAYDGQLLPKTTYNPDADDQELLPRTTYDPNQ
jgi:hypothetical protein